MVKPGNRGLGGPKRQLVIGIALAAGFILLLLGLAEPLLLQRWGTPGQTNSGSEMAGVISAIVAVVALLVAGAGTSAFFALRSQLDARVEAHLNDARHEQKLLNTMHLIGIHTNLAIFFWNALEPLMQKSWTKLGAERLEERRRLLYAATNDVRETFKLAATLAPEASTWDDADPEEGDRLRTLRFAGMNYAFFEACRVATLYQETKDFQLSQAQDAVAALNTVTEKFGKEPKKPTAFDTLETWCWVLLTCTSKSLPDPRLEEAKAQLSRLLSSYVDWNGATEENKKDVRAKYEAIGFDFAALEPLGP